MARRLPACPARFRVPSRLLLAATLVGGSAAVAHGQSGSIMARRLAGESTEPTAAGGEPGVDPAMAEFHALMPFSTPERLPETWELHDHVEIIIRESSSVRSRQDLETEKSVEFEAEIAEFPQITFPELLEMMLQASRNANPPQLDVSSDREFEGEGEYGRRDDLTGRLTAEVVQVLPNGHLVLEARSYYRTDEEESLLTLSGVVDPDRISPAGTVQSHQIFGLSIVKMHEGELRDSTKKGLFTRALETVFAF